MRDLDQTDSFSNRYGRGSNKRKRREETTTQKPSGDVMAVKNFPRTTSLKAVESQNDVGEVTAVNNTSLQDVKLGLESTLHDNRLLAGYLAHEFLTKGTLFGEHYDPVAPVQSAARQPSKGKGKAKKLASQSYAEVASLFQSEGTHIPGIVNPTELAQWIQL